MSANTANDGSVWNTNPQQLHVSNTSKIPQSLIPASSHYGI